MLCHWILNKSTKNFGSSGYGSSLKKVGNKYTWPSTDLSGFYYSFNSYNNSGQILQQNEFSFGLIGLKDGQVPYVKNGTSFYKPDNKFSSISGEWGVYYRKEGFADKDYTISFYKNGTEIYANGIDYIALNDEIQINDIGVNEVKLFGEIPINPVYNTPNLLFGASGSFGSGFPLIIGTAATAFGTGINLSMNAVETCYLLDESGNILYDELGSPLLAEACTAYGGLFGGMNLFISGEIVIASSIPLYLHNSSTTNSLGSSLPLYMYNDENILTKSVNLTIANNYSGAGTGVYLYIGDNSSDNDGYIPINSGMPLFIQRNENTYFDLFISGGYTPISGDVNLFLNGNTYPVSGNMNITMSGKDFATTNVNLYSAGW